MPGIWTLRGSSSTARCGAAAADAAGQRGSSHDRSVGARDPTARRVVTTSVTTLTTSARPWHGPSRGFECRRSDGRTHDTLVGSAM